MSICENIANIKRRIEAACKRSGREPEDIKLIAVTKTVDTDRIKEAINCGIKFLGENKVQEIMDKYPELGSSVEWHMIGHLQTNKVKYLIDKVSMIHSVDSLKLLGEIDKRFGISNKSIDVLIEINIGREKSKYGVFPENLEGFLKEAAKYKNIKIAGLMTVAPAVINPEDVRPYFVKMRELFENFKSSQINNIEFKYLSMGMTNDFEIAIEEGANIIRVGTGIFGPRNYIK